MSDLRDFYITWNGHPRFKDDEIITESDIRVIINKIEMVLFTNKGEFIGDVDFGCDIELYLWQTNVSSEFIKNIIQRQYDKYIPELVQYNYILDLEITKGTFKDILYINTTINDYSTTATFR